MVGEAFIYPSQRRGDWHSAEAGLCVEKRVCQEDMLFAFSVAQYNVRTISCAFCW